MDPKRLIGIMLPIDIWSKNIKFQDLTQGHDVRDHYTCSIDYEGD